MILTKKIQSKAIPQRLRFSQDGKYLFSSHDDCSIRWWNSTTYEPIQVIQFQEKIRDFALSPDNKHLCAITAKDEFIADTTSTLHIKKLENSELTDKYPLLDCRSVTFIDNDQYAIGRLGRGSKHTNSFIDFYSIEDNENNLSIELPTHELCFDLSIDISRSRLFCMGIGLLIIDISEGSIISHIHCDNLETEWDIWETTSISEITNAPLVACGFSAFDERNKGKRVFLIDLDTLKPVGWYLDGNNYPTNLAVSFDGKFLATTMNDDESLYIHSIDSGKLVKKDSVGKVTAISFMPNSQHLIIGSNNDQPLSIWDMELDKNA